MVVPLGFRSSFPCRSETLKVAGRSRDGDVTVCNGSFCFRRREMRMHAGGLYVHIMAHSFFFFMPPPPASAAAPPSRASRARVRNPGAAKGVRLHARAKRVRRDFLLPGGHGRGPRQRRVQLARGVYGGAGPACQRHSLLCRRATTVRCCCLLAMAAGVFFCWYIPCTMFLRGVCGVV